jgi:hypothetical protein
MQRAAALPSFQISKQKSRMIAELIWRFVKGLSYLLVNLFYSQIEVIGAENIPLEGPIIFAGFALSALHTSHTAHSLSARIPTRSSTRC